MRNRGDCVQRVEGQHQIAALPARRSALVPRRRVAGKCAALWLFDLRRACCPSYTTPKSSHAPHAHLRGPNATRPTVRLSLISPSSRLVCPDAYLLVGLYLVPPHRPAWARNGGRTVQAVRPVDNGLHHRLKELVRLSRCAFAVALYTCRLPALPVAPFGIRRASPQHRTRRRSRTSHLAPTSTRRLAPYQRLPILKAPRRHDAEARPADSGCVVHRYRIAILAAHPATGTPQSLANVIASVQKGMVARPLLRRNLLASRGLSERRPPRPSILHGGSATIVLKPRRTRASMVQSFAALMLDPHA